MPRTALIVGAGLAGSALACGLGRAGVGVEVVELRPPDGCDGAGILLTANALHALQDLGLGAEVLAAGRLVERVRFADHHGATLFQLQCSRPDWPPMLTIERGALRELLLRASPRPVRHGITVRAIDDARERPRVTLSNGEIIDCDLVVGADGLHSRVRELLFDHASPEPIGGFTGWRFVAQCPAGLEDPTYLVGNGATMLLHPLPRNRVYVGAGPIAPECLTESSEAPYEMLLDTFADFAAPARDVLATVDADTQLLPTRYWQMIQAPWRRGRCVLIGDAAHAMAPTLAQGGAMAFEDAQVLTELLRSSAPIDAALALFEDRRRARVEAVQVESLARMDANRRLAERAHAVRLAVTRQLGGKDLEAIWSRLIAAPP